MIDMSFFYLLAALFLIRAVYEGCFAEDVFFEKWFRKVLYRDSLDFDLHKVRLVRGGTMLFMTVLSAAVGMFRGVPLTGYISVCLVVMAVIVIISYVLILKYCNN